MAQAGQPVAHQHAVLVHQRHDVGHGAHRGQADRLHQKFRIGSLTRFASLACWQSAQASFSATAAPHRPANGYDPPGRRGWTIAAARGNCAAGLVVVGDDQLRPHSAAVSASATLAMPQSTVTTTCAPSGASARIASWFSP